MHTSRREMCFLAPVVRLVAYKKILYIKNEGQAFDKVTSTLF